MQKTAVLVAVILVIIATGLTVFLHASGQNYNIPSWIKNNAGWWAEGKIGDSDFVNGIQYLIEQKIMVIPETKQTSKPSNEIPAWIKNNAKWWSESKIGDSDFVNGIQYLIQQGIMVIGVEEKKEFDVIVIGAGISGLAAADYLDEKGYDVVILEARDRIGGRIWTDRSLNDIPVDLGASWIHGVNGNPITKLAEKYAIKTVPTNEDSVTIYDFEGNKVEDQRSSEIWDRFKRFETFIEVERENRDEDVSLQVIKNKFVQIEGMTKQEQEDFTLAVNSLIKQVYNADTSELSLFHFDVGFAFTGNDVVFPSGYVQIINGLAEGLDIRLEHIVNKVEYNEQGVRVSTNQGTFVAEYVISTLPLGVLKSGDVEFSPPLPAWKTQAIKSLEMGLMNKVYLLFPEVFWDKDDDFINHIAKEKGAWMEFLNIYKYNDQPIIMAFNSGEYGRKLEKLTDKEIIVDVMVVLRKIYGDDIPEPKDYVITRWGSDQFTRGSYSYTPVWATLDDYDALSKPVMNKVFFAGEATTKEYPATVHGAYLSGLREAGRIHQLELK